MRLYPQKSICSILCILTRKREGGGGGGLGVDKAVENPSKQKRQHRKLM